MVKGASGNLQKEKIINKRKHAGRRPIGIKYFEARMVYRLHLKISSPRKLWSHLSLIKETIYFLIHLCYIKRKTAHNT